MPKIHPFLLVRHPAEEAMNFTPRCSRTRRPEKSCVNGDAGPGPKGSVMVASFELDGVPFTALNGGPMIQVHRAVCSSSLQGPARGRPLLGKAFARGTPALALAEGQVRLSWQIVPSALRGF